MMVAAGHFDVLRRSFARVRDDQRLQGVIIAFSFGALLEALAGFGTPVAITSVMLMLSAVCREQALDQLRHCDVFQPNRDEALALTGQRTVEAALRELLRHVPLVAITCGADGVVAADRASGEVVSVPALPVEAIDTTGAGDVFAAAFVLGTLSGWTPAERVRFATLRASLSVRQFGGSLAAPGWHDIATWWREADEELRQDYAFVVGLLPSHRLVPVRRASATLAAVSERG